MLYTYPPSMANKNNPNTPQTIYLTAQVFQSYKETICNYAPETFALLGGKLENPYLVTDFRFCPPSKDRNGRYDYGSAHVNVDYDYMNWVIDREWKPNGKYMLGVWHSHPGNISSPSYGSRSSNEGDVVFFSSCLNNDDSPENNWNTFIAPITTFDKTGHDHVHGWILNKGSDRPVSVNIEVLPDPQLKPNMKRLRKMLHQRYSKETQALCRNKNLSPKELTHHLSAMRLMRKKDIADLKQGSHPICKILQQ